MKIVLHLTCQLKANEKEEEEDRKKIEGEHSAIYSPIAKHTVELFSNFPTDSAYNWILNGVYRRLS